VRLLIAASLVTEVEAEAEPFYGPEFSELPPELQPPADYGDPNRAQSLPPWPKVDVPFDPAPGAAAPADPRLPHAEEYLAAQAWAARPLEAPWFVQQEMQQQGSGGASLQRTYSWSHSPTRAARMEQEARTKDHKRRSAGQSLGAPGGSRGVLDAPAAPQHDPLASNVSLGPRAPSSERVRALEGQQMDIDEGFFAVKMPDGADRSGQYSDLVGLVVSGALPKGYPAYREQDGMWLPLQEGLALEDLRWKRGAAMSRAREHPGGSFFEAMGGEESPPLPRQVRTWLDGLAAKVRREEDVGRRLESMGQGAQPRLRAVRPGAPLFEASGVPSREHIAAAVGARGAAEHVTRVNQEHGMRAWGPAPPPHLVAAVQGHIMSNRSVLERVVRSVLQKAVKNALEGPQSRG